MAAPRRLASNSLKKTGFNSSMGDIASMMASLNNQPGKKVEDLPKDVQSQIIYVKDENLLDDPMNEQVYGDLETEGLTYAMKQHGFQGVILAYPVESKPGKYMIESGHRRRLAGRNAGYKEFPVYVTKAPDFQWERIIRLTGANLHGRPELSPIKMANLAQRLFDAYKDELNYKKKNGLLKSGEVTAVNELVARALEMTRANVEKYRRLLNLTPRLQNLADNEICPWSFLCEASNLTIEKQEKLADQIEKRKDEEGSFRWVLDEIKKMKVDSEVTDVSAAEEGAKPAVISGSADNHTAKASTDIMNPPNDPEQADIGTDDIQPSAKRAGRPKGKKGLKRISAGAKSIYESIQDDCQYRDDELAAAIQVLTELQENIPHLIEQLNSKK